MGTAVIRAVQITVESENGSTYMRDVRQKSQAWHTAMAQYNQNVYGDLSGFVGGARYTGHKPVLIPPNGGEADVPDSVPKAPGNQPYAGLLERSSVYNGPENLLVANTVVIIADQHVTVRVSNPTDKPLRIKRNTRIADLYVTDGIISSERDKVSAENATDVEIQSTGAVSEEVNDHTCTDHLSKLNLNRNLLNEEQVKQAEEVLERNADVFSQSSA